jgi:hypothetical protein
MAKPKLLLERRMTRAEFNALQEFARVKGKSLPFNFDEGELSDSGVVIRYHYDGAVLRVELLNKPWIFSEWMVRGKVEKLFAEATKIA